ncbi:MAG: hypothetical protein LBT42_09350 [Tannerella sp.]|jgi:hypothetical protein|nr:hypothetical protein [Tannerella sp.]
MNTKEKIYQLDDIGFIGIQEPVSKEEQECADAATRAFIQQQKEMRTPEEKEYYTAFGALLQAMDRFRQAKRRVSLPV